MISTSSSSARFRARSTRFASGNADVFFWEKFMTKPLVDAGRFRRVGEFVAPWPAFVVCASNSALASTSRSARRWPGARRRGRAVGQHRRGGRDCRPLRPHPGRRARVARVDALGDPSGNRSRADRPGCRAARRSRLDRRRRVAARAHRAARRLTSPPSRWVGHRGKIGRSMPECAASARLRLTF